MSAHDRARNEVPDSLRSEAQEVESWLAGAEGQQWLASVSPLSADDASAAMLRSPFLKEVVQRNPSR